MRSLSEKFGAPPEFSGLKLKTPPEINLEITVATPMAGGGFEAGEVDKNKPVRVPTIRGHLRYWWRLMNWNRLQDEAKIWGSTEHSGKIFVDVTQQPKISFRDYRKSFEFYDANGKERGFGTEAYALFPFRQKDSEHNIARENFSFLLNIKYPQEFEEDIKTALSAWIYFGGIGARTRRGLGSLFCKNFVLVSIEKLLKANPKISLWKKSNKTTNALTAWTEALNIYMKYRQCRNPGERRYGRTKWPEPDSLRNITDESADAHKIPTTPKELIPSFPRAALGLPIMFQFKDHGEPNRIQLKPKESGRMSSPVITKALYEKGMWSSAVIILPHDDIFDVELELKDVKKKYTIPSRKSDLYKNIFPMKGTSDAVAGFEKYISNAGFSKFQQNRK